VGGAVGGGWWVDNKNSLKLIAVAAVENKANAKVNRQ